MMRVVQLFYAIVWFGVFGAPLAADSIESGVRVAFRADAAPFSSRTPDGQFTGLFAQYCEEAVHRAGYAIIERVPIGASDRFAPTGKAFDLICDPTTITRERARQIDFTPILFIANSSFLFVPRVHLLTAEEIARSPDCVVQRQADPERGLVGVGMVGDTTANATFNLARDTQVLPDTLEYALCVYVFQDHQAGVSEICDGPLSYYIGDVDILRAQVSQYNGCEAQINPEFLAYEPYALILPSQNPDFRRKFISALYDLFADGTALSFYKAAFGDAPMSVSMNMLFRINSIPLGQASEN